MDCECQSSQQCFLRSPAHVHHGAQSFPYSSHHESNSFSKLNSDHKMDYLLELSRIKKDNMLSSKDFDFPEHLTTQEYEDFIPSPSLSQNQLFHRSSVSQSCSPTEKQSILKASYRKNQNHSVTNETSTTSSSTVDVKPRKLNTSKSTEHPAPTAISSCSPRYSYAMESEVQQAHPLFNSVFSTESDYPLYHGYLSPDYFSQVQHLDKTYSSSEDNSSNRKDQDRTLIKSSSSKSNLIAQSNAGNALKETYSCQQSPNSILKLLHQKLYPSQPIQKSPGPMARQHQIEARNSSSMSLSTNSLPGLQLESSTSSSPRTMMRQPTHSRSGSKQKQERPVLDYYSNASNTPYPPSTSTNDRQSTPQKLASLMLQHNYTNPISSNEITRLSVSHATRANASNAAAALTLLTEQELFLIFNRVREFFMQSTSILNQIFRAKSSSQDAVSPRQDGSLDLMLSSTNFPRAQNDATLQPNLSLLIENLVSALNTLAPGFLDQNTESHDILFEKRRIILAHPDEFRNPSSFLKVYGDPQCVKSEKQEDGSSPNLHPKIGEYGNWECSQCSNVNYPRRFRCNNHMCRALRGVDGDRIVSAYTHDVFHTYLMNHAEFQQSENRKSPGSPRKHHFNNEGWPEQQNRVPEKTTRRRPNGLRQNAPSPITAKQQHALFKKQPYLHHQHHDWLAPHALRNLQDQNSVFVEQSRLPHYL